MSGFDSPLVDGAWLRAHRDDDDLVIADVRWVPGGSAAEAFAAGHIPGAVSLDLDRDLAAPAFEGPGRHPLPAPEDFANAMSRVGIADRTRVVAYDDVRGSVAARLWWMLDALGHPAALLDGGLEGWDGPMEKSAGRQPAPAAFTVRAWPMSRIADAVEVDAALRDGSATVVDVRAAERYRGEVEPIDPIPGHIPGARNLPWTQTVDPQTGRFLAPAELGRRFEETGVTAGAGTITQCGSGVTACEGAFAMRVAGLGDPRIYAGSWSDWISDPARPIASGSEPG
jgi:thiosulfate/3-mercaptopyruvate sulfurtransferase